MNFAEQIEILKAAQDDPARLALATVDFAYPSLNAAERTQIKKALLTAAIPHWCDRHCLAHLLEAGDNEGDRLFGYLDALTIVEPFAARGVDAIAVQREQRLILRKHFEATDPVAFWRVVEQAHAYHETADSEYGRIEALFHLFSLDRQEARRRCDSLQAELERSGSVDSDRLLVFTLMELVDWCPVREPRPIPPSVVERPAAPARFLKDHARRFHVFLCYNSQDRQAVEAIALQLKGRGIVPWFDWWELPPGRPWQAALEAQIETIGAAAVFVGQSGLGPWQNMEVRAILSQFVNRNCPAIPVILPSLQAEEPKLPIFLGGNRFIDFRKPASHPLPELVWGITGKRPDDLP